MSRARLQGRPRTYQRGPHLYKRPGRTAWYARGGSLPRGGVCLNTTDAAEAERRLRDLLARGAAGPVAEAPREVALADLVDKYLEAPHGYTARSLATLKNRLLAFGEWCKSFSIEFASELTAQRVDQWITARSDKVSRRTINRDLRAVRVCLRWAAERGHCLPCPAIEERDDLREPSRPQRRDVPSPEEWRRVLAACESPRARAALGALLATGLRIEELRRLHAGSLRREGDGWALVVEPEGGAAAEAWTTKGYRARSIPLPKASADAVKAYLAAAIGPRGAVVTEAWLLRKLAAACAAARIDKAGVHDTRRSFVTEAYRAGVPIAVIATWCGHADVRTTEGYLSSYRTDRQVVAPVPAALAPEPDAAPAKVVPLADSRLNRGGSRGVLERKSAASAGGSRSRKTR